MVAETVVSVLSVLRSTILYQIGIFMLFEDFYHYWAHRALHYGSLYKTIHKIHHG